MIGNILGIIILVLWFIIEVGLQWNDKYSTGINFIFGFMTFLLLGVIYWTPFWLFFVKR